MHVVAVIAPKVAMIHGALDKVVPLHPVLVRGQVGVLVEVGRSRFQFFKLPMVGQTFSGKKAYGPVIVFSLDRVVQRLALAVALDANVIPADKVEICRIHNVGSRGVGNVLAAWAMALFAADVPLRHRAGFDVVIHRVAAIAGRAGRAIEISWTVIGSPPVRACFDVIRKPLLFGNVPLRRQGKVIVAPPGKIPLLVAAPVNEGDVVE